MSKHLNIDEPVLSNWEEERKKNKKWETEIEVDTPAFCDYLLCIKPLFLKAFTSYHKYPKWYDERSHWLAWIITAILVSAV